MMPTGRQLIETYDDAIERFKLKESRPYRFVVNPKREIQQIFFIYQKILERIEENIAKREREGIDQTQTRVLLNSLFEEGTETPENLLLYRELMVEANT